MAMFTSLASSSRDRGCVCLRVLRHLTLCLKVVDWFSPLRVSPKEEEDGLDMSQHGEEAYHFD